MLSNDVLRLILDYLDYRDVYTIFDITKKNHCFYYPIHERIAFYRTKSKIITRFLRRMTTYRRTIQDLDIFENHEEFPHFAKKIILFQYYFEYDRRYIGSWYINKNNWKDTILERYLRKTNNNAQMVSRYDLFLLQKQMTTNEILMIGW
jgi:hypothetical protein